MNIVDTAKEFKNKALELDATVLFTIEREYAKSFKKLVAEYEELAKEVKEKGVATDVQLLQMARVKELAAQTDEELKKLHQKAADLTEKAQAGMINIGTAQAETLVTAVTSTPWNVINKAAFLETIGYTSGKSPLLEILNKNSPYSAKEAIVSTLRHGVLAGHNPKKVADSMKKAGYTDLRHAKIVARTEMMRAYRQSSLESYRENKIKEVVWLADRSTRTCAACWAMDGKRFKIDQVPNDHPCGRCTQMPVVLDIDGEEATDIPEMKGWSSEEMFFKLSEKEQIKIMGKGRLEQLKAGKLKWRDIAGTKQSDKWGETLKINPLKGADNAV